MKNMETDVNDDVLEMAKEIGYAIQQDKRFVEYLEAKEQNDNDEKLQKLIADFSIVRAKLNAQSMNEDRNEEEMDSLDKEVQQMYQEIMGNQNMNKYTVAKSEIDELVKVVTTVIQLSASGMDPTAALSQGCSPSDCASCSGC